MRRGERWRAAGVAGPDGPDGGSQAGGGGSRARGGALPRLACAVLLAVVAGAVPSAAVPATSATSAAPAGRRGASAADRAAERAVGARVLPVPASVRAGGGAFRLTPGTRIAVAVAGAAGAGRGGGAGTASGAASAGAASGGSASAGADRAARAARDVAGYAARLLRPATGYPLPVVPAAVADGSAPGQAPGRAPRPAPSAAPGQAPASAGSTVLLALGGADRALGDEGYRLRTTPHTLTISARTPAGLFHGVQTLRELLPPAIDGHPAPADRSADDQAAALRTAAHPAAPPGTSARPEPSAWTVPDADIRDAPRYAYRGAMLDVARHFLTVAQVERFIDELALYKVNVLHLHLTDDQGWRIAVASWPRLAAYGGGTQVGGGPGGWYSQADYRRIVAYAARRFLTVVPEIDGPGHSNAALASYARLNCDGKAPARYTGTAVGFSSLCVRRPDTYAFMDDVVREVAALTPGPYLHIGGDEARATSAADYAAYVGRVQRIVRGHGKTVIGWHQIDAARPAPGTIAQYWGTAGDEAYVAAAARAGTRLIMSPANRAYLDMKYTPASPIGKTWAGCVEVRTAYDWDPAAVVAGVPASAVYGVEAPLWTETVRTTADLEYLAFPRLPGIAELGWSPAATHDWAAYRVRLAAQGPRWTAMGVTFYRSPQVDWPRP